MISKLQNKLINHPMQSVLIFHAVVLGLLSAFLIGFPVLIDALLNNPGITTLASVAAVKEAVTNND